MILVGNKFLIYLFILLCFRRKKYTIGADINAVVRLHFYEIY